MGAIVLRGGRVMDPYAGTDEIRDLVIVGDRIGPHTGDITRPDEVVDVAGLLVVPGLIDFHVHVFEGTSHYGIAADVHCLRRGVTTVVDAGSAGARNFGQFRRPLMEALRTRTYALLNVSAVGMLSSGTGDLATKDQLAVSEAVETIEKNRDTIIGVKVRIGQRTTDDPDFALRTAKTIGAATALPVMVHITGTTMSLDSVLQILTEGDIVTHCFHGGGGGILDEDGRVKASVHDARARGVLFDVGHGMGSFSFDVASAAVHQGFTPDLVSSDLHAYNTDGPVHDLVTTMAKLLHAGMALEQVVAATTTHPAAALGRAEDLGSLLPGTTADVTVLDVVPALWEGTDSDGATQQITTRLVPRWVVKGGELIAI